MLTVNELFSGIGAFRKALINLGIPHEIVGISEIDKYAIKSYEAMFGKTLNYGDISKINKLDYADMWTYGFPCQDLSIAGKRKGLIRGETRSGLLYEVQRLLTVAYLYGELPKYLIMENVKQLIGKKFYPQFQDWLDWLDKWGYNTYWKVMNAADYGIPQNRERVIAVSIHKDIDKGFSFPKPVPLIRTFRDYLEEQVDEKYFLSEGYYQYLTTHSKDCQNEKKGFRFSPIERESSEIAKTITSVKCEKIATLSQIKYERSARVYSPNGLCPTITCISGGDNISRL